MNLTKKEKLSSWKSLFLKIQLRELKGRSSISILYFKIYIWQTTNVAGRTGFLSRDQERLGSQTLWRMRGLFTGWNLLGVKEKRKNNTAKWEGFLLGPHLTGWISGYHPGAGEPRLLSATKGANFPRLHPVLPVRPAGNSPGSPFDLALLIFITNTKIL